MHVHVCTDHNTLACCSDVNSSLDMICMLACMQTNTPQMQSV